MKNKSYLEDVSNVQEDASSCAINVTPSTCIKIELPTGVPPHNHDIIYYRKDYIDQLFQSIDCDCEGGASKIEQYDSTKTYSKDDIVWFEPAAEEIGIAEFDVIAAPTKLKRYLYQSLEDNNIDSFAPDAEGVTLTRQEEPVYDPETGGGTGIVFPYEFPQSPGAGYVYDENWVIDLSAQFGIMMKFELGANDGRAMGLLLGGGQGGPINGIEDVKLIIKETPSSIPSIITMSNQIAISLGSIYYRTVAGEGYAVSMPLTGEVTVVISEFKINKFKLLGAKEVDTSNFLNTSANGQTKVGSLALQDDFENRNTRTLFYNSTNSGYGGNSIIEEHTLPTVTILGNTEPGAYVIIGDIYGRGYFSTNSIITASDPDGTYLKKWRIMTGPATSIYNQGIQISDWVKILPMETAEPSESMTNQSGHQIELESYYDYPGRYRLRFRAHIPRSNSYDFHLNVVIRSENGIFYPYQQYSGQPDKQGIDSVFNPDQYVYGLKEFGIDEMMLRQAKFYTNQGIQGKIGLNSDNKLSINYKGSDQWKRILVEGETPDGNVMPYWKDIAWSEMTGVPIWAEDGEESMPERNSYINLDWAPWDPMLETSDGTMYQKDVHYDLDGYGALTLKPGFELTEGKFIRAGNFRPNIVPPVIDYTIFQESNPGYVDSNLFVRVNGADVLQFYQDAQGSYTPPVGSTIGFYAFSYDALTVPGAKYKLTVKANGITLFELEKDAGEGNYNGMYFETKAKNNTRYDVVSISYYPGTDL